MKLHILTCCLAALAAAGATGASAAEAPDTAGGLPAGYQPQSNPPAGSIDFGQVQTGGASAAQVVMVTNSGAGPVVYTGFALSQVSGGASFAVVARASGSVAACAPKASLQPGQSCGLAVSFAPAAGAAGSGNKTALLTPQFQATAASGQGMAAGISPGARLSGSGVLPGGALTPAGTTFTLTAINKDAPAQWLVLSNTGIGPLRYAGSHLDAYNNRFGTFGLSAAAGNGLPACSTSAPIPVGGACSLQVGYHSRLLGSVSTQVLVDLADGAPRPAPAHLTGQTSPPPAPHRN